MEMVEAEQKVWVECMMNFFLGRLPSSGFRTGMLAHNLGSWLPPVLLVAQRACELPLHSCPVPFVHNTASVAP